MFDYVVLGFLISHIPITLCIDAQALLPEWIYPEALKQLIRMYCDFSKDPLMDPNYGQPVWFKALILAELTLQLPFFFIATYAWIYRREWIRIPTIIYGAHTATTLLPVFGSVLYHDAVGFTTRNRFLLFAMYSPYFVMPLAMMLRQLSVTKCL